MAHRCGGALAPENTLPGLQVSAMLGCRGVEFDVMLSADGTPWVIHDELLDRTTDAFGPVCQMQDGQLARVDAGCRHHHAFCGTSLPTFAQVMSACDSLGLLTNIEIKPATGYERATGERVAQAILGNWNRPGTTVLSSFSGIALEAARQWAPEVPRALLVDQLPEDWLERCRSLDVMAVHMCSRHLTREQVHAVRRAGMLVAVYTENDPLRARQLRQWGVSCLITDRPDIVSETVVLQPLCA